MLLGEEKRLTSCFQIPGGLNQWQSCYCWRGQSRIVWKNLGWSHSLTHCRLPLVRRVYWMKSISYVKKTRAQNMPLTRRSSSWSSSWSWVREEEGTSRYLPKVHVHLTSLTHHCITSLSGQQTSPHCWWVWAVSPLSWCVIASLWTYLKATSPS